MEQTGEWVNTYPKIKLEGLSLFEAYVAKALGSSKKVDEKEPEFLDYQVFQETRGFSFRAYPYISEEEACEIARLHLLERLIQSVTQCILFGPEEKYIGDGMNGEIVSLPRIKGLVVTLHGFSLPKGERIQFEVLSYTQYARRRGWESSPEAVARLICKWQLVPCAGTK